MGARLRRAGCTFKGCNGNVLYNIAADMRRGIAERWGAAVPRGVHLQRVQGKPFCNNAGGMLRGIAEGMGALRNLCYAQAPYFSAGSASGVQGTVRAASRSRHASAQQTV